jgi:hypothetical protein
MFNIKLTVFVFALCSLKAQDASSTDVQKQAISTSADTSIMIALTNLGSERRIPIGIVLEPGKPHQLCEEHRQVTIRDRPISEFLDALLAHSDYSWSVNDGVIVIRPAPALDQLNRVLSMKFDRFGGMQTTMQGLGITLNAWIYSRLHPDAKGYAMNILSSLDAEQFPDFEVRDASVEQILNKIVSLGDKGMWLLQMQQGSKNAENVDLHTYSYKDDVVALHMICSAIAADGK